MAIKGIRIKDFLVFKGDFTADFCKGINVFVGANSTGKTTLMNCMYFHKSKKPNSIVTKSMNSTTVVTDDADNSNYVFIPEKDMLSHSKGLLALWKERNIPFHETEIDIVSKAQLEDTREITPNALKFVDRIKKEIGGEVLYEDDVFYVKKESGKKVAFPLEASGFRKLGLLWKLLRNGLLEKDSVLFWDEPENSLNPELVPLLVEILLELSQSGVQIFLATHSEILADYISTLKNTDDSVMFYSMYKNGDSIKYDSSERFDLLKPNNLTEQPVKLYEAKLDRGLGHAD